MNITIRTYQPSDYQQVIDLHMEAAKSIWPDYKRGAWDAELDNIEEVYLKNGGNFVVGILEDEIVAMGAYRKLTDTKVYLTRMRVHPEIHRKGIGQSILNELELSAKENGYNVIELHTTSNQIAAQKLYEKSGYKEIERKKGNFDFPLVSISYRKEI